MGEIVAAHLADVALPPRALHDRARSPRADCMGGWPAEEVARGIGRRVPGCARRESDGMEPADRRVSPAAPLSSAMKELLSICGALKHLENEACALATIIHVEGSAYRRLGSRMLMTAQGQSWGVTSGGYLEHEVLHQARRSLEAGEPRIVRFDARSEDDLFFGTGLGCSGVVDVFVEPVTRAFREAFIHAVEACHQTRQSAAVATVVDGSLARSPERHAFHDGHHWSASELLARALRDQEVPGSVAQLVSTDLAGAPARVFLQPLLPPIQLVILGSWLDAVPLVRVAHDVGWSTVVVDSRRRPSSLHLFREAGVLLLCSPEDALPQIRTGERTVAVVMNHHFESDLEALSSLVDTALPMVGLLGPKNRQLKLLQAMQEDGVQVPGEFLDRLHGPVGLDLGASSPEEIALAIVAEILARLNGRSATPLRDAPSLEPQSVPTPAYA